MLGLSLGSWIGGKIIRPLTQHGPMSAIEFYAVSECVIGLGAFLVPGMFDYGEDLLATLGETNSFAYNSFAYLIASVVLAMSLFPWCFFMGTTFPFMMAFLKQIDRSETARF
jgi:spermidine synthase